MPLSSPAHLVPLEGQEQSHEWSCRLLREQGLFLESLLRDLPEALHEEVSPFSEICPCWFAWFVSFLHHRFAYKQMRHRERSSLLNANFVVVQAFKHF